MRWLVPTSFDDSLLESLAPQAGEITLYGKAPLDPVGGGRNAVFLPAPDNDSIRKHIRRARHTGFRFNYLLNAACTGGVENRQESRGELQKRLDWLTETGIDEVTVSNSSLLAIVRERLPGIRINIGFAADVDSFKKAQRFKAAGADGVTLSVDLNRDFPRLRRIIRDSGLEVTLLATLSCLPACHRVNACMNSLAHASDHSGAGDDLSVTLPLFTCTHEKLADPWKLLSAPFIRPEDLHHYRNLGVHEIKLTDRFNTSAEIAARFTAYHNESYEGNLLDLLSYGLVKRRGAYLEGRRHLPRAKIPGLLAVEQRLQLSRFPEIIIDNRALDGFLDPWLDETLDCRETDCERCAHCRDFAARAITIQGDREAALQRFHDFQQEFCGLDSFS